MRILLEAAEQVPLAEGWHRWKDLVIGPILPLAVLAVLTARRRGTLVREVTLLFTGLVALALAWPRFPGQYRMLMLAAPFGLLAVTGADVVRRWLERPRPHLVLRRLAVAGTAAVLSAPMLWGPWRLVVNAGEIPAWGLGEDARNARDFVLLGEHHDREAAPVIRQIPVGSPLYVFGHPQIYELVDGYPAIAVSGWDVSSKPRRVWAELDRELVRAQPEWIYVERVEPDYVSVIRSRAPGVEAMMAARYRVVAVAPRGIWYRTGAPGRPCGIPCDNQLARG